MFEQLRRDFRLLLNALGGDVCPLCAARFTLEREEIERARRKTFPTSALCGRHFQGWVAGAGEQSSAISQTCKALEAPSRGAPECGVCARLGAYEGRLARSMRRLDARLRFRKALEAAPLFCRRHECLIAADLTAANFAATQRVKLERLRDDLIRAAASRSEKTETLSCLALAYLGEPDLGGAASNGGNAQLSHTRQTCAASEPSQAEEAASELARMFEGWDNDRQLQRLGDLEAEAASLRYRNAVLSEENRRLKLAHNALEATCRELQRDRAGLLAAKDKSGAGAGNE